MLFAPVVLVSFANAAPVTGFSQVVDEQPSYYKVTGKTSQELSKASRTSGVLDQADGTKGAGGTVCDLTARFARELKDGACVLTGVKVTVTIRQRLPQWDAPEDAADEARDWWRKFSAAIQEHEDGHKRIDEESGQHLLEMLQYLPPEPTCDALDARVNTEIAEAQDDQNQRNADYDRRTNHGKAQYAKYFPKQASRP